MDMVKRSSEGLLIVISGPSGVGKGTICKELLNKFNAWESISMTTRSRRNYELDGREYYFVSFDEFKNRIDNNMFIEYAQYNNNYYGTPKDKITEHLDNNIDVILEIEVKGAKIVKSKFPNSVLIYVVPPTFNVLKDRLLRRNTEDESEIIDRINIVKEEVKSLDYYDYVVVNDDIDRAIEEIVGIINSEKLRTSRIESINVD